MGDWQPIETAPVSGDRVLVADADGNVAIGVRKLFFEQSGLYEVFRDDEFCPGHTWSIKPTHWQPLPEREGGRDE